MSDKQSHFEVTTGNLTTPLGFRAVGVHSGVKRRRMDLALVLSESPASVAGVFTKNQVQAACVHYCKDVVAKGTAQAIVINSGNANACTGEVGVRDNKALAENAAKALSLNPDQVLVASTGVIGVPLQMKKVTAGVEKAAELLKRQAEDGGDGGQSAVDAIMTTDTIPKHLAVKVDLGGGAMVTIGGMAKGSGMIEPNMATTLGFVTTDAAVEPGLLQQLLSGSIEKSFNRITVDGDTSTNDSVLILANGASGVSVESETAKARFAAALDHVTTELAKMVVRDGEGATKLMEIHVKGAVNDEQAHAVAKTIANSPLVKTALHGGEPNWGRILMAIGRSPAKIEENKIAVWYGETQIVDGGLGVLEDLAPLAEAMAQADVELTVGLGMGEGSCTVWTCDLSAEYVHINGSYIS